MTTPTANILATIPLPMANGASAPALDIDFTTSPSLAGLGVTFSRTSTASYFDATGTLQSAASGAARYDYGTSPGGVTNWLRNSTMANSGGIPTNWGSETDSATGYTVSYAYGVENSLNYVDVTLSGTPTSATYFLLFTDSKTALNIAYAAGQTWTHAANLRVSGGSLTNIPSVLIGERISDRTGAFVFNPQTTVSLTTTSTRYSATGSSGAVQAAYVTGVVQLLFTTGNPIQLTLRISAPQLEQSASPSNFVPTSGTAVNVGAVPLGLLVEESRTNSIRNSTMAGASSPSTAPTLWSLIDGLSAPVNGLSTTVVGTGTESGIAYIDFRMQGTATAGGTLFFRMEGNQQIAASNAQVWTASCYLRLAGGSLASFSTYGLFVGERDASGASLVFTESTASVTSAALATQRITCTRTNNNASTAFELPALYFNYNNGGVIDATVRIGLPQLELGAFATSAIPTSSVAVTRASDFPTMTPGAWFNGALGSFRIDAIYPVIPVTQNTETFGLGVDSGNVLRTLIGSGGTQIGLQSFVGGANQLSISATAVVVANAVTRTGFSFNVGSGSVFATTGGYATAAATSTGFPTFTTLYIGGVSRGQPLGGYMRRIRYWPRELSKGELIAETSTNPSHFTMLETTSVAVAAKLPRPASNVGGVQAPTIDLDFLASPRVAGLTFTRGSIGTYFDQTGTLQTALANVPRYDTNPSTLVMAGLLIEEQRVNSIRNNTNVGAQATDNVQRITNGSFGSSSTGWTVNLHGGTGSVTFGATTASLVGDNVNQTSLIQSITTIIGVTYTFQVTVATNPVFAEVGTASNGTDIASGVMSVGTQTLQFTAVGTTTWIGLAITTSAASPTVVGPVSVIRSSILPTNWTVGVAGSGLTQQVVATGAESGINYVDLRFFGTANTWSDYIRADTSITASAATAYAWSFYWRLTAGSLNGVTFAQQIVDGGGGSGNSTAAIVPTSAALATQRVSLIRTTSASTTTIDPRLQYNLTSGWAVDFTLRIGMPQSEQGNFASSVIPTSGSAVTRNSEAASMPVSATAFVQNAAGSVEVEYLPVYAGNSAASNYALCLDDGTNNNRYLLRAKASAGSTAQALVVSGGSLTSSSALLTDVVGTVSKLAMAWTGGSSQNAVGNNGTVQSTASAAPVGTLIDLYIGVANNGGQLNGWIRHVAYWPRTLSNTELGIETSIPAVTFNIQEGATISTAVAIPRPATNIGTPTNPSLDIDLTNGTSMATLGITFGRNSNATYFDSTGTLQTAGPNVARYDYNPATLGRAGLLIEEARTNVIRNNTMVGAVSGSPGTMPTNWQQTQNSGLVPAIVGTGTENGITYIDLQFLGTASAGVNDIWFEITNNIAAVTAQVWTISTYLRLVNGTTTNFTGVVPRWFEYTSGNVFVTGNNVGVPVIPTAAALATQRLAGTLTTFGGATTAFIRPAVEMSFAAGPVNCTLRVGLPQLELSSYATSVIPTSSVAVTRVRDDVSITTGSWFNANAGSLSIEYDTSRTNVSSAVHGGFSDGTFANSLYFTNLAVGAVGRTNLNAGTLNNPNIINKMATAWASNFFAFSDNGSAVSSNTAIGVAPFLWTTRLSIGCSPWASDSQENGHVRHVRYWPRALTPAELIRESTTQATTFQMVDGPTVAVAGVIPRPSATVPGAIQPSLDWDFTNAPSMASLGITFARASTATYIDATGTMQTALAGVARYDYNPTTRGINGLLLEEARTNAVRNPRAEGAVAGTPGTAPTNWSVGNGTTGLSSQIIGVFVVNGISCLRVRFFGNPTSTGAVSINYEVGGGLTGLTTSQSYTQSWYLALSGGSWANIGSKAFWGQVKDSGNANIQDLQPSIITPTSVLTRQSNVQTTPASGTTPFNMPQAAAIFYMGVAGPPVDFTVDFGAPQLEIGAFATSAILPPVGTPAASTRASETALAAVGSWYSQTGGSISVEASTPVIPNSTSVAHALFEFTDTNTPGNRIISRVDNATSTMKSYWINSSSQPQNSGGYPSATLTASAILKHVMTMTSNSWNLAVNGSQYQSGASGYLPPTITRLNIGFSTFDAQWAGYIRHIRYWPRILTTAEIVRESTVQPASITVNVGETEAVGGSIPRPVAVFQITESPAITASVSLGRPIARLVLEEVPVATVRAVLSLPSAVTKAFRGEVLSETSAMARPTAVVRINEGASVRAAANLARPIAVFAMIGAVVGNIRSANARPVARAEGSRINPTTRIAVIPAESRTVFVTAL